MAKTGNFFNSVVDATDIASVDQTFDAARKHTLTLNSGLPNAYSRVGKAFSGKIEGIVVKVKSISGAAKITIKGVAGGAAILPDTEATIALDVGSATEGTVAYLAGFVWENTDDTQRS